MLSGSVRPRLKITAFINILLCGALPRRISNALIKKTHNDTWPTCL